MDRRKKYYGYCRRMKQALPSQVVKTHHDPYAMFRVGTNDILPLCFALNLQPPYNQKERKVMSEKQSIPISMSLKTAKVSRQN